MNDRAALTRTLHHHGEGRMSEMSILSITGAGGAGKTHALIAVARAAALLGSGAVAFVSPWPGKRELMRGYGLDPEVRFLSVREARLAVAGGYRPSTVLFDEFDKACSVERSLLVSELRLAKVDHLVIAGYVAPEPAALAA